MSEGAMAEEEIDYESDPEETKLSLKMRRREASDDEEEEGERVEIREKPPRRIDDSDAESEGAPAEYEDEFGEEGEQEDYELDEDYAEEIEVVDYEESGGGRAEDGVNAVAVERAEVEKDGGVTGELMEDEKKRVNFDVNEINDEINNNEDGQHEGEKKEIEPYAVPTAGAFYMHDDRFRDNAAGRHRRTLGGRKLWESKDDRKWGHDKFEEITIQERSYEERRRGFRGRNRGRGRSRAGDHGYAPGNRPREHASNGTQNNNNQNNAPKSVRGRGPRRYQSSFKNKEVPLTQNKQSGKSVEKSSYSSSVRTGDFNAETDVSLPRKQVFASNLNIASPPFYPSGSSTKDSNVLDKRDVQAGSINRNGQPLVVSNSITMAQSSVMPRGKNIVDSIGVDKLSIGDSLSVVAGKPANTMQKPLSGPSSINSNQQQWRGQGRGLAPLAQMAYQPALYNNQLNRVNPSNQLQTVQRNHGQVHVQSSLQASGQQFTQHVLGGSQASSPPKAAGAVNVVESGELESPSESGTSKTVLDPKGKGSMQGSGRGSFLYGGAQVIGASGNVGSGQGDQNYPTFLPVMQFGGQHPGRIGVPAVGMAFPGYVGQPQLGLGNSEMTWLPVLTGAAGALGKGYGHPYIPVDGSYHALPSGQLSSITAASSKENNAKNIGNDWKAAQRPEVANEDFGQRQKNPRRYTEMKFDQ